MMQCRDPSGIRLTCSSCRCNLPFGRNRPGGGIRSDPDDQSPHSAGWWQGQIAVEAAALGTMMRGSHSIDRRPVAEASGGAVVHRTHGGPPDGRNGIVAVAAALLLRGAVAPLGGDGPQVLGKQEQEHWSRIR